MNLVFTLSVGQVTGIGGAGASAAYRQRPKTFYMANRIPVRTRAIRSTSIPGLAVTAYAGTTFTMPDVTRPDPFPLAAVQVPVDRLPDAKLQRAHDGARCSLSRSSRRMPQPTSRWPSRFRTCRTRTRHRHAVDDLGPHSRNDGALRYRTGFGGRHPGGAQSIRHIPAIVMACCISIGTGRCHPGEFG